MITQKTHKAPVEFICDKCDFKCCNKKDYNRHLSTRKHKMITNDNAEIKNPAKSYICDCGKKYNFASGLSRHKINCKFLQKKTPKVDNTPKEDDRDKIINLLFKEKKELMEEKKEMKDLVLLMVKNMQDNQNVLVKNIQDNQVEITTKIIKEMIPHVGAGQNLGVDGDHNNLTNCNNTLNFYLTNTCKDAESITEFTARFCERIETFFNGNYQKIANNQTDLAKEVQELFFECLEDKPQVHKFIQTTDTKNGVYYVKEPNKVEKQLTFGDSEFVKYKDSFEKPGARIGHAINKTLQPCKTECLKQLENTLVTKPKEEDYDDYEEFEKDDDRYRKSTGTIKENLMFQTHKAMCLFDNKKVTEKTMSETKRPKQMY
jgi:hypothetical protein